MEVKSFNRLSFSEQMLILEGLDEIRPYQNLPFEPSNKDDIILDEKGYIIFEKFIDGVHLKKIYVKKEFRGKGLAKKMIEELRKTTDNKPIYLTIHKYNESSQKFFKKVGARFIGEVFKIQGL